MRRFIFLGIVAAGVVGALAYSAGYLGPRQSLARTSAPASTLAPAVTVAPAVTATFIDTVAVTGSLVARNEILIAPEVEGLRIVSLGAEEGDDVKREHVLARLEQEALESQLAQNAAALARAAAAIAQARSQIVQAEARLSEADAAFERAKPLQKSGAVSEAVYDQREAAARTAAAQLTAARDGLTLAEAERTQIEAQRRELTWRRSRIEVKAPADGLVTRRSARIGGMATAAGEPMFRIAASGEIELEAEVPEADLARIAEGQTARIVVAGAGEVEGHVRLVSPEVDKTTRLGKVRIYLGKGKSLRIGAFGRGVVEVARTKGLAVPSAAVTFTPNAAYVLLISGDTVHQRRVKLGLQAGDQVEITHGLADGDLVIAKSATFLRDGDRVRPRRSASDTVSQAQ
jgi:HlyD family secretion protein